MLKPREPSFPVKPSDYYEEFITIGYGDTLSKVLHSLKVHEVECSYDDIEFCIETDYGDNNIVMKYKVSKSESVIQAHKILHEKALAKYRVDLAKYLIDMQLWLDEQSK